MRKFIAFATIAFLYMTPMAAFSQRRGAPQTKVGRLTINVSYEVEQNVAIDKKDGDYAEHGTFHSKFTAKYQFSESIKAISHDGFVSLVEPAALSTNGKFTYEQSGHLVDKAPSGGNSETDEKNEYTGEIIDVGTGGVETPDQGDEIIGANASAYANANGFSTKTIKDRQGTTIDKNCSAGLYQVTFIDVPAVEPDKNKPPEKACSAKMQYGAGVAKIVNDGLPADDLNKGWGPLSSSGSFASGQYMFSYKGSREPNLLQKNADGEKINYRETLIVEGVLGLGGGSVKKAMNPAPRFADNDLALGLLPKSYQYFGGWHSDI
jgi:hypothetical protein